MPCFYCGKRVSLVRQMSDPDFCSDEHRKRYRALMRLALKSLLDEKEQTSTPEPRPEVAAVSARPAESVPAVPLPVQPAQPPAPKHRGRHQPNVIVMPPPAAPVPAEASFVRTSPEAVVGTEGDLHVAEAEPAHSAKVNGWGKSPPVQGTLRGAALPELPPSPVIIAQPRPLPRPISRRSAPNLSPAGGGRKSLRLELGPASTTRILVAGLDQAGFVPWPQVAGNRRCAARLSVCALLAFRPEAEVRMQSAVHLAHGLLLSGWLGLPAPSAMARRSSSSETACAFTGRVQLPVSGSTPAPGAAEIAPPPTERSFALPLRPATRSSVRRFSVLPDSARPAELAELCVRTTARHGVAAAGLERLAQPGPVVPKPALPKLATWQELVSAASVTFRVLRVQAAAMAPAAVAEARSFLVSLPGAKARSAGIRAVTLGFAAISAPVPEFCGGLRAGWLRPAGGSVWSPRPSTPQTAPAWVLDAGLAGASVQPTQIPAPALQRPRVLAPCSLREAGAPGVHGFSSAARAAAAVTFPGGAVLPATAASVRASRCLGLAAHADVPPPSTVRAGRKASPVVDPRPCSWPRMEAELPAAQALAVREGVGRLSSAEAKSGVSLTPLPKAPVAAVSRSAELPFVPKATLVPAEPAIQARQTLECMPGVIVRPGPRAGAAPRSLATALGFVQRWASLPDITTEEAPVVRMAAARHLGEQSFEFAAALPLRDAESCRTVRGASAPVPVPVPASRAAGWVAPVQPFKLGLPGLQRGPEARARDLQCRPGASGSVAFAGSRPEALGSPAVAARHGLRDTAPESFRSVPRAGSSAPADARIVPASTHPLQFPGEQPLGFASDLGHAPARKIRTGALNRVSASDGLGWLRFQGRPTAFSSVEVRIPGVSWPSRPDPEFVKQPGRLAIASAPVRLDARGSAEFAAPVTRLPQAAPAAAAEAGEAPAAKLPALTAYEDARTFATVGRLAPVLRSNYRPSRLPIFRATVEKVHMRVGVFQYIEIEDVDDESTTRLGPCYPAMRLEPASPKAPSPIQSSQALSSASLVPVSVGPYSGARPAAPGFGSLPFAHDIYFIETSFAVMGPDFEEAADEFQPRWRSALKTASGIFRSVMLLIPILVLGMLLTGCSANGGSVREAIEDRAAVHLEHDFAEGMKGWHGGREWATTWSRDAAAGFVRGGQLALYQPSQRISDYRFEFFGQIDGRSLGWVFRAADLQNYYAAKLVVVRPGPRPEIALDRYQVVGGQETQHVEVPVRMILQNGRPYRIQQDVVGQSFTTSIEDEVVDSWTDDRLRTGGVGLFGGKGDSPHFYWIKLTYQNDFWGKLCASLSPNN